MSRRKLSLIVLAGVLLIPALALTQDVRQGPSQVKRRGGADPVEQMQKRVLMDVKRRLAATNDEWKALAPKIEKVILAQRDLAGPPDRPGGPGVGQRPGGPDGREGIGGPPGRGRPGGFGRRNGPDGPGGPGGPDAGGRPDGMDRPDGPGGPDHVGGPLDRQEGKEQAPPESKVFQARRELRNSVDAKDASAESIAAKLAAYRQARDAAREALTSAQKDLKAAVSPKQEAILVVMSLLD